MPPSRPPRAPRVVVTGCLAQRYAEDIQGINSDVDVVMGFEKYSSLPDTLRAALAPAAAAGGNGAAGGGAARASLAPVAEALRLQVRRPLPSCRDGPARELACDLLMIFYFVFTDLEGG